MKSLISEFAAKTDSMQNTWRIYLVFIASGIIGALAFIFPSLWFLSFFCLVPVVYPIFKYDYKPVKLYGLGFIRSYAFYFVLYSWFSKLYPLDFLGLSDFSSVCICAAAMILIPLIHSLEFAFVYFITGKARRFKPLCFAAAWILAEYFQSLGAFGFSWGKMSISVFKNIFFLQSAELFGNYFTSLLIVLINAMLAYSIIKVKQRKLYALVAAAIFVVNCGYGAVRILMLDNEENENVIKGAIIQGNADSNQKWSANSDEILLERYISLSERAASEENIDLYVLPETAIPISLSQNDALLSENSKAVKTAYTALCKKENANMIVGAFWHDGNTEYNSAFLINKHGFVSTPPYNKRHLVPFGEYLPYRGFFENFIPVLASMNAIDSDLGAGESANIAVASFGKIGSLVCFDSIFDELARDSVKSGAQLLTVVTNDSWYKDSAALHQHLAQSVFRAVENRRHVLRAANTGISASISKSGRIEGSISAQTEGYLIAYAPLSDDITLYTRIGNVIIAAAFLFIIICFIKKKHKPLA